LLAIVNWIGADGGGDGTNWSDGRNWDSGTVPAAGDDVFIEVPNLIVENGYFTIRSLSSEAPLEITGSLTTSAASTCNGTVSIDGGGITSQGAFTFNNTLSLSGALVDSGPVTMNGLFTWTAGAIYGGGAIQADGGINISGDASKTLND